MFSIVNISKLFVNRTITNTLVKNYSYKSPLSLEKLYPKSNLDILARAEIKTKSSTDVEEEFSGYIPIDKVQISHKTCSKPGGQHVNKTQSGVEIRFHLDSSDWIPKWIRDKIKEKEINRISKDGYLIFRSEKTRKALLNQADCMEKIRSMIFEASKKPRGLTEDEQLKITIDKKIADGRRLISKRRNTEAREARKHSIYDSKFDYYEKW